MELGYDPSSAAIRCWWLFLFSGILLFIAGCGVLRYPVGTYLSIALLLGMVVVGVGVAHIYFAVANSNKILPRRPWHLMLGIFDLIIGIVLLTYPDITMAVLPPLVGIWFLIRGASLLVYAFTIRRLHHKSWGWFLAGGILIAIFAGFIIYYPVIEFFTIVIWTAGALMITGISNMLLAFRLRSKNDDTSLIL